MAFEHLSNPSPGLNVPARWKMRCQPVRPALNAQVQAGLSRGRLPGWRDVLRSRNRPIGSVAAQLFSRNLSGTGLAFCIAASSMALLIGSVTLPA
jgi:hypothetical protein